VNTCVTVMYSLASLSSYGLTGLTGRKPPVRGTMIAEVGMAIALIATLLLPGMSKWLMIAIGAVIGTRGGALRSARSR